MGRRCRRMLPPPLPPLFLLWFLATPLVDTVTPRPVEGVRVQRYKPEEDGLMNSQQLMSTKARSYNTPPSIRHILEWRSEDEDEDDAEEGSGASSSSYPTHVTSIPPPSTHRLRHDKSPRADRRPHTSPSSTPVSLLSWTVHSTAAAPSRPPYMDPVPTTSSPPVQESPSQPPRRRLRAHDACYSSNEVLLVVGVTCAVNFAFILVVVALVHLCNRQGAAKVVPAALEYETPADGTYCGRRRAGGALGSGGGGGDACDVADASGAVDVTGGGGGGATGAYARVQEYVDSLPDALPPFHDEEEEEGEGEDAEEGGGGVEAGGRAPRRRSTLGLHAAFSMEQLLFLD